MHVVKTYLSCRRFQFSGGFCFKPMLQSVCVMERYKCKRNLFTHGAPSGSQELVQKCRRIPESNWNLEMLVFKERGKPEYPEKKSPGAE